LLAQQLIGAVGFDPRSCRMLSECCTNWQLPGWMSCSEYHTLTTRSCLFPCSLAGCCHKQPVHARLLAAATNNRDNTLHVSCLYSTSAKLLPMFVHQRCGAVSLCFIEQYQSSLFLFLTPTALCLCQHDLYMLYLR
jgi:hypothetical protein